MTRVSTTEFRSGQARWIDHARRRGNFVILTSHGREVVALVSMEDLKLIWNEQDERKYGPINPASGRPFGQQWVLDHFGGHYERHRDPESHLRPSREEAPWLGRPFDWPREAAVETETQAPPEAETRAEAGEAGGEAPAPARPWWRWWRR